MRLARRLIAALVTSLLLVVVAAPAVAIAADSRVLATESQEAPGPEPLGPNDEGNFGAPTDHEGPRFARFVAAVLTIAAVGGLLFIGYLYFLLVKRPQLRQSSGA